MNTKDEGIIYVRWRIYLDLDMTKDGRGDEVAWRDHFMSGTETVTLKPCATWLK